MKKTSLSAWRELGQQHTLVYCGEMATDIKELGVTILLIVTILIGPALAQGQTADDFEKIEEQFWNSLQSGKYSQAEVLSERLYNMASGPLADTPQLLVVACARRGLAYEEQNRYIAAEQFYKQGVEVARKVYGAKGHRVAGRLSNLAGFYYRRHRYTEAELFYKQALEIDRQTHILVGDDHPDVGYDLEQLAYLYADQCRYLDAEPLFEKTLKIYRKVFGGEGPRTARVLNKLAIMHVQQGHYEKAEQLYQQAFQIFHNIYGDKDSHLAEILNNMGDLNSRQARYAKAEMCYKQAAEIFRNRLGGEHPAVASSLNNLAALYEQQGRYAEAEPLLKQSLEVRRKALGEEHPLVAQSYNNLGVLNDKQARFEEAESFLKKVLEISRKIRGGEHLSVSEPLDNLGNLRQHQGRYSEAELLYKEALKIRRKALGDKHPDVSKTLNNLAALYYTQGRYIEAESLHKKALAIKKKVFGPEHPDVATSLNNLANLYWIQGRYVEAEPLYKKALEIRRNVFGDKNLSVATSLSNLATFYSHKGCYLEAESLYKQALEINRSIYGDEHPNVAGIYGNLAMQYKEQGQFAEAEQLNKRSLAIQEKILGSIHPHVAETLSNQAALYLNQGRYVEAEALTNRATAILDKVGVAAVYRENNYRLLADVHWSQKRTGEAVANLKQAMNLAEQVRAQASGGEWKRAATFAQHINVFERMVAWQKELGGMAEALDALERSRARGLLDQIETRGMDLLAGVPDEEAETLRRREAEAQGRLAGLQKQLQVLDGRNDLSAEEKRAERERITAEIRRAQREVAEAYAAVRNASPAYRLAVGKDLKPVAMGKLQSWVADQNALLLEYLAGSEGGYVLIVPSDGEPRLEKLALDEKQAEVLGVDSGPLTVMRLSKVFSNDQATGVLDRLRKAKSEDAVREVALALSALWDVLIPEPQRQSILEGKYERLIVLPDGAMAKLPFETLVVENDDDLKYLLDVGPAIEYAPSATILMNLAERREQSGLKDIRDREPVLTVGDCVYKSHDKPQEENLLALLTPRSRLATVHGEFGPIEYAKREIAWVSQVFGDEGTRVAMLKGDDATEAAVRLNAPGRRFLHFACHGLVDESYGNLFGALVLTPGPDPDDATNDGYLTLAEVYGMDLKGCELSILSACETNVGPQQRGEGVWALSRGFLVSGSRRVLASNWLVTDEDDSAARFVSYFTSIIAKAENGGRAPDYAEAVHRAKLFLRHHKNKKWNNPYYWGTFVLIGPD